MSLHKPVLLNAMIKKLSFLADNTNKKYSMIDCTLGTAGHSKAFLETYPNLAMIGPRQQNDKTSPASIKSRFKMVQSNFTKINNFDCKRVLKNNGFHTSNFDIIFADFGYNSLHLENAQWGFSYMKQGELDMRYSPEFRKCADVLADVTEFELSSIFTDYGQLNSAQVIAHQFIEFRKKQPIRTTKQIEQIIQESQGIRDKFKTLVKVFQALRIFVNGELLDIRQFCRKVYDKLNPGGKCFVITFHSLEEKAVKQGFSDHKRKKLLSRWSLEEPDPTQIQNNVSSRSAKLFSCERIQ